jgi:hypothetical protein
MVHKAFCVPALVTSFIAIVLLVLTTVSMPTTYHKTTPFEIVRANNLQGMRDVTIGTGADNGNGLASAKFGIWGYCTKAEGSDRFAACTDHLSNVYTATFASSDVQNNSDAEEARIRASYTRGLVIAPVALVVSVIAFIISFIPSLAVGLAASIVHLLATLITLAAFIVQVVFFVYVRVQIRKVSDNASVMPGPAFYFTLVSIPLLFFSALTVCCGWRKGRKDATYDTDSSRGLFYTKKSSSNV